MRANYETAFERETDCVCRIVENNPHRNSYTAMIVPEEEPVRRGGKARRQAGTVLAVLNTALATLTVIAATSGDWKSAFAGAAVLLVLCALARITD